MKVLHLGTSDSVGGAATAMYRWHKSLRKLGVESQILCLNKSAQDEDVFAVAPNGSDSTNLERNSLQHFFIDTNRTAYSNTFFSHPLGFVSVADHELVRAADVIHVHWTSHFFDWREIKKIKSLGKAVVLTPHDLWTVTGGCHYPKGCDGYLKECQRCPMLKEDPGRLIPISRALKQQVVAEAVDVIVSPSRWMDDAIGEVERLKKLRRVVIPYCVDVSQFGGEQKEIAKRALGFETARRLVLFCAEHVTEGRKGLDSLIEVFKICESRPELRENLEHNAEFVLIGKGSESVKIPTVFRVHGRGYVTTTEELCCYYSAADLVIYLGLEDNLPNVILEAMAVGAPVLGFNTGGVGDMIVDGVTGDLVRRGDVTNFASRLAVLLSDSKKLAWLGMNSRETALRRFSEQVVGLELRKLYGMPGLAGKASNGIDSRVFDDFELAAQRTTLTAMVEGYRSLEREFHASGKKFDELKKIRDTFKKHYKAAKTQYNALKKQYNALARQYDVAQRQFIEDQERWRQKSLWELFKERLKDRILRVLRDRF